MDAPLPLAVRRRRRVRALAGVLLAAVASIGVAVLVLRLGESVPSVARAQLWTASVRRGDFAMQVQGAGVLRPEELRWLTAESAGRVEGVLVKAGTRVEPGTVIVRLENLDLQLQADEASRDVQAARAQALALEHQQARDELTLEQEVGALQNELSDATRRASTFEQGAGLIVSRNESAREADRAAALTRQVELARDKLALLRRLGPRQRDVAEAQRAQLDRVRAVRQEMLDRLLVRAPTGGTVQEMLVEPGQWVLPGAAVAKLMISERLEAVLRIPADEVGAVAAGQPVLVHTGFARSAEGTIGGRVRRVAPAAQDSTVDVEVELDGALPESARADQSIDGAIQTRRIEDTLSLPRPVGLPIASSAPLYRIDPATGRATRVSVRLGLLSSDAVQILAGLDAGDEVILSDMSRYAEHEVLQVD
jgi:multidrug resistance efflux pump